jgi:hypothetical protein
MPCLRPGHLSPDRLQTPHRSSPLPATHAHVRLQNVASRMESTCQPGRIHVSAATQARLPNESWQDLGMRAVKGKGEMRTYEWAGDVDGPLDGEQVQRVLGLYL